MDALEFQDPNPVHVNVLTDKVTAETLIERKIDCTTKDKVKN